MKTLLIFFAVILTCGAYGQGANPATPQKIGYADPVYVFSQMPEYKKIENEMKIHNDQLTAQAQAKYKEYDTKLKAYQAGAATMLDPIRKDKENELTQLQENMQKFQQEAQASLQKKEADLVAPINARIGKAIEEVAKEQGYTFIINPDLQGGAVNILLYADEKYDVSLLVLKKLGITPAPATTTTTPKK